ncbi:MAG: hypothetical protein ABF335_05515 [Alphaproteobacteria bacterium]
MSSNEPTQPESKKSMIPWLFVLAFVAVFAANGVMIGVAMDSFPGFSTDYELVHAND